MRPNHGPTFFEDVNRPGSSIRRLEGQRDNCADARHGHQSAAYWIILRQVAGTALQFRQSLPQACPRPEYRLCRSFKHGIATGQFPDAKFKPATGDGTDLKPEVSEQPSNGHFQGDHALLDGFASPKHSMHFLR
jgi:hypothetical protein